MARFEKGQMPPVGKPISEETAREYQRRSQESHLRNKRGAELVQALLEKDELDPKVKAEIAASWGIDPDELKKEAAMHARQIDKAIRKADTFAYMQVLKAAGYDETTLNIKGGLHIVEPDKEKAAKLAALMDR